MEHRLKKDKAYYHLPGLFEFFEFYQVFLPLFYKHREYFYDWCEIGSIYGAPADCLWGGGRVGSGDYEAKEVLALMEEYGISARLTFSNSQLKEKHLFDKKCNELCRSFEEASRNTRNIASTDNNPKNLQKDGIKHGVILHSELLLSYLKKNYPDLYLVSSTTKVITDFSKLKEEADREEFAYVVPDFRLNKQYENWKCLTEKEKSKIEFLCNECCYFGCKDRKKCYETVSRQIIGENCLDHLCSAENAREGYRFSRAMENPGFIGLEEIKKKYLPMGFSNFKLEGRGLGSALVLEFLLYYMTKPEYQIHVREEVYLDNMLDLF